MNAIKPCCYVSLPHKLNALHAWRHISGCDGIVVLKQWTGRRRPVPRHPSFTSGSVWVHQTVVCSEGK
jgi:hypothetical protein